MECKHINMVGYTVHSTVCFKYMRMRCNYRIILSDLMYTFRLKFMRLYHLNVWICVQCACQWVSFRFFCLCFLRLNHLLSLVEMRKKKLDKLFLFSLISWVTHYPMHMHRKLYADLLREKHNVSNSQHWVSSMNSNHISNCSSFRGWPPSQFQKSRIIFSKRL